jgi:hypothetical protein
MKPIAESSLRNAAPPLFCHDHHSCGRGKTTDELGEQLDIRCVPAPPCSPESRGKIERSWPTLLWVMTAEDDSTPGDEARRRSP